MPASAARAATATAVALPRRPLRRRHPPAGLDQRPRRHDRRAHRACSATASAPTPGPGRRCCAPTAASASSRGTTAAPAAPTARRPRPRRHRGVRRGRALGDGPLRGRPGRADGLVDRREHDVRAGPGATPSGSPGCSRSPASRATRSPPCSARCGCPASPPGPSPSASPGRCRLGGRALTPIASRLPVGPRAIAAADPHRLHVPGRPTPSWPPRAVAEFLTTPVDWYFHLALRTSEHARVSLSRHRACPPSSSPAPSTSSPAPATWRPRPSGIAGRDVRRAPRQPLPADGAARARARAAARPRRPRRLTATPATTCSSAADAVTTPVTVARREARRSVASTAGPSTTSATALVIARPVSQLPVEVSSV